MSVSTRYSATTAIPFLARRDLERGKRAKGGVEHGLPSPRRLILEVPVDGLPDHFCQRLALLTGPFIEKPALVGGQVDLGSLRRHIQRSIQRGDALPPHGLRASRA